MNHRIATATQVPARSVATVVARTGLLLYVDLWILEGAARKWVPGVENVFYFARDGLALLVIVVLLLTRRTRSKSTVWFWVLAAFLLTYGALQAWAGFVQVPVMIVGLRSYLAPLFPVIIFLLCPDAIGARALGKRVIFYLPLQLVLAVIQVSVPASSIWNAQVNGEVTQFTNLGIARVTGTFSAPAGYQGYVLIALAIALAFLIDKRVSALWGGIAAVAAILCIAISGSRGSVFGAVVIFLVLVLINMARGNIRSVGVVLGVATVVAVALAIVQSSFGQVLEAFLYRFETAAASEDTSGRLWDSSFGFVGDLHSVFGNGMGVHSQAGIAVGSPGPWIEADAARWVSELGLVGLIIGIGTKVTAVALAVYLVVRSGRVPTDRALLLGAIVPVLLVGQITVSPSTQGALGVTLALLVMSADKIGARSEGALPRRFPSRSEDTAELSRG